MLVPTGTKAQQEHQDTVAVIIITSKSDGVTNRGDEVVSYRTWCKTDYDMGFIMKLLAGFFFAVLEEPCIEALPQKQLSIKKM